MIDLFWYVRITNPYTLFAWIANPSNAVTAPRGNDAARVRHTKKNV